MYDQGQFCLKMKKN